MASILVVDDDEPTCRALLRLVRFSGHAADCALDPYTAIDVIRSGTPDLIILDVNMPGMSGIDVLALVKSDEATAAIPVIMYTAAIDPRSERRARELGAADVWVKSAIHFGQIESKIEAFLRARGPA
jgi:CheY-like chemotaxis protein